MSPEGYLATFLTFNFKQLTKWDWAYLSFVALIGCNLSKAIIFQSKNPKALSMQSHTAGAQLGFSDRGCKLLVNCISTYFRAVVVAGAEGADAPVNFEKRVHAPLNFQPFQSNIVLFLSFCGLLSFNLKTL